MNITKLFVGLTSRRSMLRGGLVGPGIVGAALLAGMPATSLRPRISATATSSRKAMSPSCVFSLPLRSSRPTCGSSITSWRGSGTASSRAAPASRTYTDALNSIDNDMSQYIHDNTDDEFSHASFLNAYLQSKNAYSVSLEEFQDAGRQPGDWFNPEKTADQPDAAHRRHVVVDALPQQRRSIPISVIYSRRRFPSLATGEHTAIPRTDADPMPQANSRPSPTRPHFISEPSNRVAAACIRRWRSASATSRCCASCSAIGPTETMHFQVWHDKAGNIEPMTDRSPA